MALCIFCDLYHHDVHYYEYQCVLIVYPLLCRAMHQLDNMADNTDSELPVVTCNNDQLYSQLATHSNTLPYSTEGEAPGEYSVISEKEQLAAIGDTAETAKEVTPTADNSVTTETQDASIKGLVYSAVVRQDGKKTTVKTTAVLDGSQQQQQPDTSNEGLVYSAVVVKDGMKTTVKTTFFKD